MYGPITEPQCAGGRTRQTMSCVEFLKHSVATTHRLPDEPADGIEDNLRLLLSHVNQKGVRATLISFLRLYAGVELPPRATAIDPVLLRNVVKKTGRSGDFSVSTTAMYMT